MKKIFLFISLISITFKLIACSHPVETNIKPSKNVTVLETSKVSDLTVPTPVEPQVFPTQEASSPNEVIYSIPKYGEIQEYGGEFYYDEKHQGFYYHLECFYLNSDFLYTMNETLENIYHEYHEQYLETENWYMEQGNQNLPNVPYSKLDFLGIEYIDNDYVSLLFDDITHMGSAVSYSHYDAITLDRHTGKEVTASEILGQGNTEILKIVNRSMGLEGEADWKDLDFYLKENKIIFFYRIPGIWEEVEIER